jgi:hypothetical protein
MNFNERLEKALAQAREMQRTVGEAMLKANDQLQPMIAESVKQAAELQSTLAKHAAESGAIAQQQTKVAMEHVGEYIKVGSDALRQSAAQARESAQQMAEQSRKVMEATTAAMAQSGKTPAEPPPSTDRSGGT